MSKKYPSKYSPCICGNLDKKGVPTFYSKCCGDKPNKSKMYFDETLPDFVNSNFQLIEPFLTTNPAFFGQLDFQVKAMFDFTELDEKQLDYLYSKGVPVFNPSSYFSYNFLKANRFLKKEINKEKFFVLLFEVLHNEVQIAIAKALFNGDFVNKRSVIDARLIKNANQMARLYYQESGEWRDPEKEVKSITSIDHMKARWILDDCVLRIRSQWDKLLYLLSKGVFNVKIKAKELNYDMDKGKIGQLRKSAKVHNTTQQDFLDSFCRLILQIESLKKYRDNLSHTVSERVQNCLGGGKGDIKTIDDLSNMVDEEHKRVQEAFVAVLGVIVSGSNTSR